MGARILYSGKEALLIFPHEIIYLLKKDGYNGHADVEHPRQCVSAVGRVERQSNSVFCSL